MSRQTSTTRREFLLEAAASGLALTALRADVLASQQGAGATGLPTRVLQITRQETSATSSNPALQAGN